VLVLDASAAAFIPQLSAPRSMAVDTRLVSYLTDHLGLGRFYSIRTFHSDYGAYFGAASIDTTDLPVPSSWATETGELAPNTVPIRFDGRTENPKGPTALMMFLSRLPLYEQLDVRYLVIGDVNGHPAPRLTGDPAIGLRLVYDDGTAAVYAVRQPSAYWSTTGARCSVSSATLDAAVVDCPAPATLLRAGLYLPGWTATVNGAPAAVTAYQDLLTSIHLPAGLSQVVFSYQPPRTELALAGFLVGMVLLIGIPLSGLVWRRRQAAVSG
jgi:hypothetical protein